MNNSFDLKSYLMSDFSNNKHKNISLMELYASDNKYYSILEQKHLIEEEAMQFFQIKGGEIKYVKDIPTEAFRKLRYELIIDRYLRDKDDVDESTSKTMEDDLGKDVEKPSDSKSNNVSDPEIPKEKSVDKRKTLAKPAARVPQLHCVDDKNILIKIDVKKVKIIKTGKSVLFPRYKCPYCKRRYTLVQGYKDLQAISLDGVKYTNITLGRDDERYINYLQRPHRIVPGTKCYAYGTHKPVECRECGNKGLLISHIEKISKKRKRSVYQVKFCPSCKTHYLAFNIYLLHEDEWDLLNEEEIPSIKEELRIKAEEKARRKAEKKALKEARELKRKEEQLKKRQEEETRRQERLKREQRAEEERQKRIQEQAVRQEQQKRNLPVQPQKSGKIYEHDNNIRVKDFVVRRTTFKCRHNAHRLQNIDAVINIINKDGDVKQTTVSAGYCPNCNLFFIMESTYQKLKMRGTPICRVSDEKAYLSNSSFINGMRLAQESILMQYGYTVSQAEGLTSARRRKILAILMDNNILTRSDIISYLDFFINQRKNQHRFEKAIEKWENDREFVSEYKSGSYSQYGVGGIYRKY